MADDMTMRCREDDEALIAPELQRSRSMSARIMFVGVSKKEGRGALDGRTMSGAMVDEVVDGLPGLRCLRTNLIDRVLVDAEGRLRSPTAGEVVRHWSHFEARVRRHKPNIIVALGAIVARAILKRMAGIPFDGWTGELRYHAVEAGGRTLVTAHHPAHIAVYRREDKHRYITALREAILQGVERRSK